MPFHVDGPINRKVTAVEEFRKAIAKRRSRKAQRKNPKSKRDSSIERGSAPRVFKAGCRE